MQVHSLSANIGNDDCDPQAFFIGRYKMYVRNGSNLVMGVGINDADYLVNKFDIVDGRKKRVWVCPIYKIWSNMLTRCYSEKCQQKHPTYASCSVSDAWLTFSNFRSWVILQQWEGMEIDKDLIFKGCKLYSSETCTFVTQALNCFLTDRDRLRGAYPLGVTKAGRMFRARCRNPFTLSSDSLGNFASAQRAHIAWLTKKHEHACRYADMQDDPRVAESLRTRYLVNKDCPYAVN